MRFCQKRVWSWIIAAGMLTLIWSLLWGKLFPYAPIHLGFVKQELEHSIVFAQIGAKFADYQKFDLCIPAVEKFHELKFVRKPIFFVFRDRKSYLQRSVTKARFYAYSNGTLVISPWAVAEAQTGQLSLETYVKHELSHTILFQNMGIWAAYRYPRWLLEGIAVYSANQMGTGFYPSREETRQLIKQGVFLPPKYFKTWKENRVKINTENPIVFAYSEFACFVDYLVATDGKEKLLVYMKQLLEGKEHDMIFRKVYGREYAESIHRFRKEISEEAGQ